MGKLIEYLSERMNEGFILHSRQINFETEKTENKLTGFSEDKKQTIGINIVLMKLNEKN